MEQKEKCSEVPNEIIYRIQRGIGDENLSLIPALTNDCLPAQQVLQL